MGTSRWRRRRARTVSRTLAHEHRGAAAEAPPRQWHTDTSLFRRCPPPPINSSSMPPVTLSTVKTSVGSCLSTLPPPPPTNNDRIYLYRMA